MTSSCGAEDFRPSARFAHVANRERACPVENLRRKVQPWIVAKLAKVLGHDVRSVGLDSALEDLGLESMAVVAMGRELEEHFPSLAKTFLYDCRTVEDVARYLWERFPEASSRLADALPDQGGDHPSLSDSAESPFQHDWESLEIHAAPADELAATDDAIAIIGMAGRYPGAADLPSFGANLQRGIDAVTQIPDDRWGLAGFFSAPQVGRGQWGSASRWGGFLADVDAFDSGFFGVASVDADVMDPQERLFIECAWHALENAGLGSERLPRASAGGGARVGVFAGVTTQSYPLLGSPLWQYGNGQIPTAMPWSVANRVSYLLNFDGPSFAVDTACSSSLTALHLACGSLRRDECEIALVGGVNLYLHPAKYVQLSQQRMLSPTGRCHAFGEAADGFVPGEGVGVVVLRRLNRAITSGDRILAVIRATTVAHGGRTNGYTVPSSASQATLIRSALERACVGPERISFVEAHGTGTGLGDPLEIDGLASAWFDGATPQGRCAIGSVKSNVGHLESAAGIAGLTKILLQLRSETIFPSLHSGRLNKAIDLSRTPFYIPQQAIEWRDGAEPRCAALSSFGAGGANAHVILEAWQGDVTVCTETGAVAAVFPFSASDAEQLGHLVRSVRTWLLQDLGPWHEAAQLARLAYTLQVGRTALRCRVAVVARTVNELVDGLAAFDAAAVQTAGTTVGGRVFHGVTKASVSTAQLPADASAVDLASQWVVGGAVEWAPRWPVAVTPVEAPLYPFRKTRHWVGDGMRATYRLLDRSLAPVQGDARSAAEAPPDTLQACVRPDDWRVADHLVDGHPVFPAAAYLQLVASSIQSREGPGAVEFSELMWGRALVVEQPASIEVRLRGQGRFQVVATDASDAAPFLAGTVKAAAHHVPSGHPPAVTAVGTFDRDAFYGDFARMGLQYGGAFRSVISVVVEADRAVAELQVPARADQGWINPALLDGVFQCALALAPASIRRGSVAFVPFSLKRFALLAPLGDTVRVAASYRGMVGEGLHAFDFDVWSGMGVEPSHLVARLEGFCFRQYEKRRGEAADLHLLVRRWEACETATRDGRAEGPILVVGVDDAYVEALADALAQAGSRSPLWSLRQSAQFRYDGRTRVEMDLADPAHRRALLEVVQQRSAYPATLIYTAMDPVATPASQDLVRRRVRDFVNLAQSFVVGLGAQQLRLVYAYAPADDESRCFHAAVAGLLRSLHLEAPRISATVLELDAACRVQPLTWRDLMTGVLMRPLARGQTAVLRRIHGRLEEDRFVWAQDPDGSPTHTAPWRPSRGGVYLITGGMGALGRTFARWLTRDCGVHVALVGRSPADAEIDAALTKLECDDARAAYFQLDLTDDDAVRTVLARIRASLGPLTGVIHSAGVLRDAFFLKHSDADWHTVLAPKIDAALRLDEATREDPLEAFILFSSLAGAHGNVGQSVYAYANSWLDEYAQARARAVASGSRRGRTLAIAWPLWRSESGMQAPPPVMDWMAERGLQLLEPQDGIRALQHGMAGSVQAVVVCYGRRDGIARTMNVAADDVDGASSNAPRTTVLPAGEAASGNPGALPAKLLARLTELLSQASGTAVARIAPDTPVQSLGLDSIMVMGINSALEDHFATLPKTLLYEVDTVQDLAMRIQALDLQAAAAYVGLGAETASVPDATPAAGEDGPGSLSAAVESRQLPNMAGGDHGMGIAIVGVAGRYPRANDLEKFWDNLVSGVDCVSEISTRWPDTGAAAAGKTGAYARWAALIDDHDGFDPLFFGIAPRDAERMDPQERLFLETSWLAVENAGYTPQSLQSPASCHGARARVGVLAGVMYGEYQFYGASGSSTLSNSSYASIANRVSYTLGFNGPSFALDSMCSSSLTAIHTACLLLKAGECDVVLAGGVNVSSHPYRYRMLSELKFAASDGRCRSFGAGGDGYVPGEGVGVVVLKRLDDALQDGDAILGVIRGSAIGHGGRTSGFTVPSPVGQSEVIADAFRAAQVDLARLGYVEAHGTGTSLGDPIELRGLSVALQEHWPEGLVCPIGSVKSQIGHLESAAGIAALTKVLLQMRHATLAPSIHAETLNPNIDFSHLPFRVQRDRAPWVPPHGASQSRLAAVSSFGAGGSNAHLVVEEWTATPARARSVTDGPQWVVLSARTPEALGRMAADLEHFLARHVESGVLCIGAQRFMLADVAATLREARVPQQVRVALLADDFDVLGARLRELAAVADRGVAGWQALADVFAGQVDGETQVPTTPVDCGEPGEAARAWVSGALAAWAQVPLLPPLSACRRVPLPGTRFQRRRFWAQPVPALVASAATTVASTRPNPPVTEAPKHRETAAGGEPASPAPLTPAQIYERVVCGLMTPEEARQVLSARIAGRSGTGAVHSPDPIGTV